MSTTRTQIEALRDQATRTPGLSADRARACMYLASMRYPDLDIAHKRMAGGGWDPATLLARPLGSTRWQTII